MKKLFTAPSLTLLLCAGVAHAEVADLEASAAEGAPADGKKNEKKRHHHFIVGVDAHLLAATENGTGDAGGGIGGRVGWHNAALGIFAFRPEFGLESTDSPGQSSGASTAVHVWGFRRSWASTGTGMPAMAGGV